jgi:16S rRNA processing protein RimM
VLQALLHSVIETGTCASMSDPHSNPPPAKRILLGVISGAHGIRGDVIVRSYTADPGAIAAYGTLETANGAPLPRLTVVRVTQKGVIARLDGIVDRTGAERFKGLELWIARASLPAADPGEYYHADLIGLTALAPDGAVIGTVIAVENFGAGDLIEIALAGAKRSEYVPFTNACVPAVDIIAGQLTIIMPTLVDDEAEEGPPTQTP